MKRWIYRLIVTFLVASMPTIGLAKKKIPAPPINDVYVVLFIVDGAAKTQFDHYLDEGDLPTIKKYMVDEGTTVKNAFTVFPSASATAYFPFVSGLQPGHGGIPYADWFDRTSKKKISYLSMSDYDLYNDDYLSLHALLDPSKKDLYPETTIFDLLKGHPTASLYSHFSLNASIAEPDLPIAALWSMFVTHKLGKLDDLAMDEVTKRFSKRTKDIPRFSLVGLISTDLINHEFGFTSDEAKINFRKLDKRFADFIELLKKQGIFDKTYIIVTSDHGGHNTSAEYRIEDKIKKSGMRIREDGPHKKPYELVVAMRGVGSVQLYLKSDTSWKIRPTLHEWRRQTLKNGEKLDLVSELLSHPELDLLIIRDNSHSAHVFSDDGHGILRSHLVNGTYYYEYSVEKGSQDPLQLTSTQRKKGKPALTSAQWQQLTANSKYPGAVAALSQIFHDGRSGDAIVIAKPKYSFRSEKKSTHGTLLKEDMHIPMMIRGPGIAKETIEFAQSVDLFPTIASWFGVTPRSNHDGMAMFNSSPKKNNKQNQLAGLQAFINDRPSLIRIIDEHELKRDLFKKFPTARNLDSLIDKEIDVKLEAKEKLSKMKSSFSEKKKENRIARKGRETATLLIINQQLRDVEDEIRKLDDLKILLQRD